MEKISLSRLRDYVTSRNFLIADLPPSNQPDLQKDLHDLYVASCMASAADAIKKRLAKAFKDKHKDTLKSVGEYDLDFAAPFKLTAKVSNPRKQFDQSAFIRAIAKKYDISISELHTLADDCKKATASPVSFTVENLGEAKHAE